MARAGLLSRVLKATGVFLLAVVLVLVAFYVILLVTAPEPRHVEGWSLGAPLPTERGELATVVLHAEPCDEPPCPELERLYVLGGLSGLGRPQDRVSSYDPADAAWTEEASLPAPRHHPGAAALEQAVYLSGGTADISQPWDVERNFWRLEAGADDWEQLPPMPEGRWGHRMVEHEGRLYVIGGMGPSARVLIYVPGEGWETGAEMPAPRDHLSVVVADDRIWAIGGRHPESMARVDIYDPENDTWESGPDLPEPTSGAAEGVLDRVIMVFGGEEPDLLQGEVFDRHWMLDARAEDPAWQPAPAPPLAVHGADGAIFQETMVIVGGASRHGFLSITAWADAFQWLEAGVIPDAEVEEGGQ